MKFIIGWVMKKITANITNKLYNPLSWDLLRVDCGSPSSRWEGILLKIKGLGGLGGRLGYFHSVYSFDYDIINL